MNLKESHCSAGYDLLLWGIAQSSICAWSAIIALQGPVAQRVTAYPVDSNNL